MPHLSQRKDSTPMSEELLTEIIDSPHHEQLVARLDGKIVGTATLSIILGPAAGRVGYLEDFVTDSELRGIGIGAKLWDEIVAWCNEHDIDLEFTSKPSREAAHKFYRSHGAVVRETTVFHVYQDER